jgi:DinB superfamily
VSIVADLPGSYAAVLARASGAERHRDLSWSVGAYVCHVADNLRIWAERLAGASSGSGGVVGPYDENLLAAARAYDTIPLVAAQWSLTRAVGDWLAAVADSPTRGVVLRHPERGDLTLSDVVRANAHDAAHHRWDIQRTLDG